MADYDLFVIGGGSGGVACARRAAAHGARVALAEASRLGGTCVIRGCVPKKLMRYAAMVPQALEVAAGYGWRTGTLELDWAAMIAGREREIARLEGVYRRMLDQAGVRVFDAFARAAGPGTVEVAGDRVTAERILIAVGGRPELPDLPGIEHAITSDDALEGMLARPESFVVVGGGYIGLEQASIFAGLGVPTTLVIRRDLPLRGFDDDLRRVVAEEIVKRGVDLRTETVVTAIRRDTDGVVVETDRGPTAAGAVLYATGRTIRSNTADLGLEALGVATTGAGAVRVDEAYRSSVSGIYAVGDCCDHAGARILDGEPDLTPIAIAEGRALAEQQFAGNDLRVRYDTTPSAIFSLPEAASVGPSERAARAAGHDVEIYRTRFRPMLYTIPDLDRRTFMKLIVDRAGGRVLACHMVGDDAAEIIQGLAVAITAGATKADFDATVALHPTAAEEFVTMHRPD